MLYIISCYISVIYFCFVILYTGRGNMPWGTPRTIRILTEMYNIHQYTVTLHNSIQNTHRRKFTNVFTY